MLKNIFTILFLLSSYMANDDNSLPLLFPNSPFLYPRKPIIFPDNFFKSKPKKSTGSLALGSDNKSGLLWVVLCMNTSHGNVPGKLDKDDNGFYAWGGKEHKCLEWE